MQTGRTLKICILHRYPLSRSPGYPSIIARLLLRGHEIFTIENSEFVKRQVPILESVHRYPLKIKSERSERFKVLKALAFTLACIGPAISIIKKHRVNLVLCANSEPALCALLLKKLFGVPIVIHVGDMLSSYLARYYPFLPERILRFIETQLIGRFDKIMVVSCAFRNLLLRYNVSEDKIKVVYEGVDTDRFSPKIGEYSISLIRNEYNLSKDPIVMFHGAIEPYQGIETIVYAARDILKTVPNTKFVIVGSGSMLDKVKRLVAEHNLRGSFIFTGWVPDEKLPKLLRACRIGVILRPPELASEVVITGKLLQYLASAKPVVAPNLSAIREVVKHGVVGYLYVPSDLNDLSDKVTSLLKNPSKAEEMGKRGRELVEEKFSWKKVGDNIAIEVDVFS